MSDLIVNSNEGINKIKEIQFGVFSPNEISKLSVIECINHSLYDINNKSIPIPFGPNDRRLGVNRKDSECTTCGKKIENCPGHFGYVRLSLPIFHIGFFKKIIEILRCICKNCSRILLPEEEKKNIKVLASKMKILSSKKKKDLSANILKLCAKVKVCPYCGALNGKIKHVQGIANPTIIVHEIDKKDLEKNENAENFFKKKFESSNILYSLKTKMNLNANRQLISFDSILNNSSITTIAIELTSPYVYNLFSHIPPEDIIFFGMDSENSSPVNLLLQYILVPPLPIRPTVSTGDKINEDDLTAKIKQMIETNNYMKKCIIEGTSNTKKLMDDLVILQSLHSYYIDSNTKGIDKNIVQNKQIRSLCTRLKGKKGRFRGNLSGKRVDFTGRTVISPDPNLYIDQLGIPILMAKNLTYPEKVNEFNIKKLKKLILNGKDKYPGASFIIKKISNKEDKLYLGINNRAIREKYCNELKIGDIVERHLMDGDIILFNRQPSLHRVSIMSFYAKVLPWRTLRFNLSNCTPFNADFDGDEMNIHLPQTEEARAEAKHLMNVILNIQSPKNGEPLIASTQDFLTATYLITQKDYFLDRTHFQRYCTYFNDGLEKVEIPPPAILKPKELWTGKQLFSVILKPNKNYKIIINLKTDSKSLNKQYLKKKKLDKLQCPNDGYVIIRNSELLTGIIDKATIGKESKSGIVFALIKDCGLQEAAKFLARISKFSGRWICDYGMSFGLGDCFPRKDFVEEKKKLINQRILENDQLYEDYKNGNIRLEPGLNAEESLEANLNKKFSEIRDDLGKKLKTILSRANPSLQMVLCGSKGSESNLCQMIGCVGQQSISNKRVPDGFINRSLPHFEIFSKKPDSKGFVGDSFFDGMNSIEFFFHTMGGREGLIDTSVKTSETGYMQRRLVKALEDLTVQYNNTVAMSNGEIVEFLYGDDGIEPLNTDYIDNDKEKEKEENDDKKKNTKDKNDKNVEKVKLNQKEKKPNDTIVYIPRLWDLICSLYPIKKNNDKILEVDEIREKLEDYINKCPFKEDVEIEFFEFFIKDIRKFFIEKIKLIENAKKKFRAYEAQCS